MMSIMKRIGYAGLFLLVGVFFPILIWFAAVVAIRRALKTHAEARAMATDRHAAAQTAFDSGVPTPLG